MIRFAILCNFTAAIIVIIASFFFATQNNFQIFPVLVYLALLGLPGIFANSVLFGILHGCRSAALALHFFALVVLGILFVLACLLSPGSGAAALPFIFAAMLVNFASIVALRHMANA